MNKDLILEKINESNFIECFNLKLGEMTSDDIMVTGDIETVDFEKIED